MEFEYFLADRLHMTVARMRAEMGNAEYVMWTRFHARRSQQRELEHLRAGV